MTIPKKLYKYQPVSLYSLKNLKNNQIYFNHPTDFNDPYDTSQEIQVNDLTNTAAKDLYFGNGPERRVFEKVERKKATINEAERIAISLSKSFTPYGHDLSSKLRCNIDQIEEGYFAETLLKHFTMDEVFEAITSSYYSNLNQVIEVALKNIRKDQVNTKGISCFSEKLNDLLMWSYYADGHKGFCLEFNTSYEPFTKAHKVKYVSGLPSIDADNIFTESINHTGIVKAYLATKFTDWSHEKEWRILHNETRQLFTYKPNALTGVYFGTKINFTDLEILSLIIKGQSTKCKFYRMEKVTGKFEVRPVEFSYTSYQEAKNIVFPLVKDRLAKGIRDYRSLVKGLRFNLEDSIVEGIIESIIDDMDEL